MDAKIIGLFNNDVRTILMDAEWDTLDYPAVFFEILRRAGYDRLKLMEIIRDCIANTAYGIQDKINRFQDGDEGEGLNSPFEMCFVSYCEFMSVGFRYFNPSIVEEVKREERLRQCNLVRSRVTLAEVLELIPDQ